MKLVTYRSGASEFPGVLSRDEKTVFPFSVFGLEFADMNAVVEGLDDEARERVAAALPSTDAAQGLPLADVELLAPIPCPHQDLICLGLNYAAHVEEAARFHKETFIAPRTQAVYFSKRVNRAVAPGGAIDSHRELVQKLDYECELAAVLKKDVRNVSRDEARDTVFGYMIVNDVSARDIQTAHKQWYFGKSLDGFAPMGPCILTADEVADFPPRLDMRCLVNGEVRQNSNTALQLFPLDVVIAELSAGITLRAGTIISTGTPSGVGLGMTPPCFLVPGDVVTCTIEGIGTLENTVV